MQTIRRGSYVRFKQDTCFSDWLTAARLKEGDFARVIRTEDDGKTIIVRTNTHSDNIMPPWAAGDLPASMVEPMPTPPLLWWFRTIRNSLPVAIATYFVPWRHIPMNTELLHQLAADPVVAWSGRILVAAVSGSLAATAAYRTLAWMVGTAYRAGTVVAENRRRVARERQQAAALEMARMVDSARMLGVVASSPPPPEKTTVAAAVPQKGDTVRLLRDLGDMGATKRKAGMEFVVGNHGVHPLHGIDLQNAGWCLPDEAVVVKRAADNT